MKTTYQNIFSQRRKGAKQLLLLPLLGLARNAFAVTPALLAPTNITTTAAAVQYAVDGSCTGTLYYGQTSGSTNATNWTASVALGALTAGTNSLTLSNLTAGRIYYLGFAATTNGTNYSWATGTNFWTLAAAPTNLPTGGYRTVLVDTNNGLVFPTIAQLIAGNPALASTNGGALAAQAYDAATGAVATASAAYQAATNAMSGLLLGTFATATNAATTLEMDCTKYLSMDVTNALTGTTMLTMSNMMAGAAYTVTVRTAATPRLFNLAFAPTGTVFAATASYQSTTIPANSVMIITAQKTVDGAYIFNTTGAQ